MNQVLKHTLSIVAMLMAFLFVGIRIYNHISAWGGVLIIIFAISLFIYLLTKIVKKYEKD